MFEFRAVTPGDAAVLREYLLGQGRICDNTPGTAVMWRGAFKTQFAITRDTLVMKLACKCCDESYALPYGENADRVIDELVTSARERGKRIRFRYMSEERAAELSARYGGEPITDRKWADYLYPAENFVSYAGKKLREKRNHMNRFLAEHENWEFRPIDSDTLPSAREFYLDHMAKNSKSDPIARREEKICLEVFDRWDKYGFSGGVLIADGRVVGITAGEAIGDTLYVHIEKADREVNGAYQMTASCFVRSFGDSIPFVNREDDSGDEGLRRSKMGYRPCEIVFKYSLEIE